MTEIRIGRGTVLAGRFTLEDLLDEKDGARFWRARDQTLARSVAVHVLPDSDARAGSLLTAARTSALVSDGHLLRVLDAAAEDGVVYVVNEWGSGVSLDRMLVEGPLSPRRAAWVVKEIAEAIATGHRNGVAHGRLLPENVMISEAGSVKLIGFVIDAVLRSDRGLEPRRVTGGDPLTAQESDVINLAALLYAALVGKWPGTDGSGIPAAPSEHGRPLRPRQVRAGVPRPLDAICERVLNPGVHPHMLPIGTAHEIYAALSDYIGDPGAAAPLGDRTQAQTLGRTGPEPTAVFDRADLTDPGSSADTSDDTSDDTSEDTSDLRATGGLDPEATQAGEPMFFDVGNGVGWRSSGQSQALREDGSDPGTATEPRLRPTPPPLPPEQPERPLFADGPSAAAAAGAGSTGSGQYFFDDTGSFTGSQRSTGAGNGSIPPAWGPDANQPGPEDRPWDDGRDEILPGRTWLRLAVVLAVVLVVVIGAVFVLNLSRGSSKDPTPSARSSTSPSTASAPSTKVAIAGVTDFDPEGDPPEENPDLAPLAVDGKPGTAWHTVTYRGNPKLGGLKKGVGLRVDLGKPAKVGEVRLTLLGKPTSLQILAAPGADVAPTSTDGLTKVATADGADTQVNLKLKKTVTTQWLVVWLTSLPPAPGGYQGRVAEISVRS